MKKVLLAVLFPSDIVSTSLLDIPKYKLQRLEPKYFKCSKNGTDCVETKLRYHVDDFSDFELKREKREIWTPWRKREPICRLDCTCDPDVSSNIDQASAIKQKSDQKQKVTVEQAFGIGSVLAVIGALIALGSCCFIAKSNLYPFVKCRQSCLKIISPGDREASMMAKQKEEMGAPLTKREKQAKSGIENITNKAIEKAKLNVPSLTLPKINLRDQGPPPAYEDIETVPSAPMLSRNFGPGLSMASSRKYVRASRASLPRSTRSPRSRSGSRAGVMTPAMKKEEPSLIK